MDNNIDKSIMRLRPYKSGDAEKIAGWLKDETVYLKWGGKMFGDFPVSAEMIDDKYKLKNGDCAEADNFYPWTAFDDEHGIIGHFIMRYVNGDNKTLRFGWVIVDDTKRGTGFGKRMLKAGLHYAFELYGAETVTIGVFENNEPAHKCYRSVGFTDTAVNQSEPRNVIEMAISKADYYANK